MSQSQTVPTAAILSRLAVHRIDFAVSYSSELGFRIRLGPAQRPVARLENVVSLADALEWMETEANRQFPEFHLGSRIEEFRRRSGCPRRRGHDETNAENADPIHRDDTSPVLASGLSKPAGTARTGLDGGDC